MKEEKKGLILIRDVLSSISIMVYLVAGEILKFALQLWAVYGKSQLSYKT